MEPLPSKSVTWRNYLGKVGPGSVHARMPKSAKLDSQFVVASDGLSAYDSEPHAHGSNQFSILPRNCRAQNLTSRNVHADSLLSALHAGVCYILCYPMRQHQPTNAAACSKLNKAEYTDYRNQKVLRHAGE
jgi:hypothetical protein